jgi:apoptosis-inducing factor 3
VRTPDYYQSIRVDLIAANPAVHIRPDEHKVILRDGRTLGYGALLLATGAEPRSLSIPGADLPHVHRLRTLADSKAIIATAGQVRNCVVIGSSFIGLEVAASLRSRGLDVTVISQDSIPLEKILGKELGRFVQTLHETHGVRFLLNTTPQAIFADRVQTKEGKSVSAELVVLGVGVSPRTVLAEQAGIRVGDGVLVNEMLRTSAPEVFAAGDIARYPEPVSGERARIEHWVVAQRHGQAVARAMLGITGPFRQAPFFWSQHYDVTIAYVGHASQWDSCQVQGDLTKGDACAVYRKGNRVMAVATIGRDRLSLQVEGAMETGNASDVESLL